MRLLTGAPRRPRHPMADWLESGEKCSHEVGRVDVDARDVVRNCSLCGAERRWLHRGGLWFENTGAGWETASSATSDWLNRVTEGQA